MKAVTPSTLLRDLYQPGQKMLIDFAGDRLSYIDTDTGEEVFVETYVAIMPYSGMTFVMCVRSQGDRAVSDGHGQGSGVFRRCP